MEKKTLKISSPHQLKRMVQLLQHQPDLATGKGRFGSSKQQLKESWEKIAVELNSMGPPKRTTQEWQRVWIHYKANLKRKLINNKKYVKTAGGGPSEEKLLNPLEQTVASLFVIPKAVDPEEKAFGVSRTQPLTQCTGEEVKELKFPSDMGENENITPSEVPDPLTPPSTQKKTTMEEERLEAIKNQAANQVEILKTLRKMEETMQNNYDLNKKTYELKKKKLDLLLKKSTQKDELHKINMLLSLVRTSR